MKISLDNNPVLEHNKLSDPEIIEDFNSVSFLTNPKRTSCIEGGLIGISLDPSEHESLDNRNQPKPDDNKTQDGGPSHE